MNEVFIEDFENTLFKVKTLLGAISEELAGTKKSSEKWSIKEIIGHLIDSASNNHQRFCRLSYNEKLVFPEYNQNEFVNANKYNTQSWNVLKDLFLNYNYQLIHLIKNVDDSKLKNVWTSSNEVSFDNLINDYLRHLKHHFKTICELPNL